MTSLASGARSSQFLMLAAALALGACSTRSQPTPVPPLPDAEVLMDLGSEPDLGSMDATRPPTDMPFDPDMACTSATAAAVLERLPADIIWVVDNSSSMDQEIENVKAGINAFAAFIETSGIDYRVIMLSKRGVGASGTRYSICVPPPLAGDAACGNGPRFFHSSIDILSTQPLEQILGTLGQTTGYGPTDSRGGEPWRDWLRIEASKTFVVVTDDNARLSAMNFEHFRGPPPASGASSSGPACPSPRSCPWPTSRSMIRSGSGSVAWKRSIASSGERTGSNGATGRSPWTARRSSGPSETDGRRTSRGCSMSTAPSAPSDDVRPRSTPGRGRCISDRRARVRSAS